MPWIQQKTGIAGWQVSAGILLLLIVLCVCVVCACCCRKSEYTKISGDEDEFDFADYDEDILGGLSGIDPAETDSDEGAVFEMGILGGDIPSKQDDDVSTPPRKWAPVTPSPPPMPEKKTPSKPVSGRLAPPPEKKTPNMSAPAPVSPVLQSVAPVVAFDAFEAAPTVGTSEGMQDAAAPPVFETAFETSDFDAFQDSAPNDETWDVTEWEDVSEATRPMSGSIASDKSVEDIMTDLEAAMCDDIGS